MGGGEPGKLACGGLLIAVTKRRAPPVGAVVDDLLVLDVSDHFGD